MWKLLFKIIYVSSQPIAMNYKLFINKLNVVNYVNMHTKCGCEHVDNL